MSFSLDLSDMFTYAAELFNSFGPVIAIIGGLSLGVGLVYLIIRVVKNLFSGG
jgi:formate-dependent nitrite reductase membrane component NrfD